MVRTMSIQVTRISIGLRTPTFFALCLFCSICFAAPPGSRTDDTEAMQKLYTGYGVASATLAGDLLFIGGLAAFNDDGSVYAPNDGSRQMMKIISRLQNILSQHNASAMNIVKVNSFVTDWDEFNAGYVNLTDWFDKAGAEYSSGTAVGVTSLAAEGLVVEMDFVAYLGD